MKYAIMSDAHANPAALKTALADALKRGCGKYVFLGDATGYGYDAASTISMVKSEFDIAVLGNHDAVCIGRIKNPESRFNTHYAIDRMQAGIIGASNRRFLEGLPYQYDCPDFSAVHGDFICPKQWNYILNVADAYDNFLFCDSRIMFCGHTHHTVVYECVHSDGPDRGLARRVPIDKECIQPSRARTLTLRLRKRSRYIVNCGSVGYPREDKCSSYVIFDSARQTVTFRMLPFDYGCFMSQMDKAGLDSPDWMRADAEDAAAVRNR